MYTGFLLERDKYIFLNILEHILNMKAFFKKVKISSVILQGQRFKSFSHHFLVDTSQLMRLKSNLHNITNVASRF